MAFSTMARTLHNTTAMQIKIAKQVIEEKERLTQLRKERDHTQKEYEYDVFKTNQLNRKITNLQEYIPRQEEAILNITKEIEDLYVNTDNTVWQQTKAKVVLESEQVKRQKYFEMMEKHIEQINQLKTEREVEKATNLLRIAENENMKKKQELIERKDSLTRDKKMLKTKQSEKEEIKSELDKEILLLQKRKNALMLRCQTQLRKSQEMKMEASLKLKNLQQKAERLTKSYSRKK